MKQISQLGEFDLIKKIQKWCPSSFPTQKKQDFKTLVPLGDDAYVVKMSTKAPLVFTTDTLIEGTHFKFNFLRSFLNEKEQWQALGYKSIAINLSDFAAMGDVKPLFAFVTLGLNGDISVDSVDNLYTKMKTMAKLHHFIIAGGDIIRSEKSIISVTLCGKLLSKSPATRSGAEIGDVLMVTGPLGLSAAGLKILIKQVKSRESYIKSLVYSHIYPKPKMREGKILSDEDILATSMIDTSDDLVTSLEILSEKNRSGFELNLENVPVHPALLKISEKFKISPFNFILYGGEDYQLLFTVPGSKVNLVKKKIPKAYVLGTVKPKSFGIQLKMNGKPFRLKDTRFKHFKEWGRF